MAKKKDTNTASILFTECHRLEEEIRKQLNGLGFPVP